MKKKLIGITLIVLSVFMAAAAFGQSTPQTLPQPTQTTIHQQTNPTPMLKITQDGQHNQVSVTQKSGAGDSTQTTVIEHGTNKTIITTDKKAGSNQVNVSQSGSGNRVNITKAAVVR
jgi:biopolymer transport protein ExbD